MTMLSVISQRPMFAGVTLAALLMTTASWSATDHSSTAPVALSVRLGFAGMGQYPTLDDDAEKPSDVQISVGPGRGEAGRIVEVTNNGVQLYDKAGATVSQAVSLERFAGIEPNRCFDPRTVYDAMSQRFFVVMPETKKAATSRLHVIVSRTSTPRNLSDDWIRMAADAGTTMGGRAVWLDYPCVGTNADALFITGNMSDTNGLHRGVKIRVVDKEAALNGELRFHDLDVGADLNGGGTSSVQPARIIDAAPTEGAPFYLLSRCSGQAYRLWKIDGAPASPHLAMTEAFPWESGVQIRDGAPQKGKSRITIHTSSGRVMNAVFRNGWIWCTLTADANHDGRTEVLWFKISVPDKHGSSANVSEVVSCGTIAGTAPENWTFVPAIGVARDGTAVATYSESGADQFVEMRAAILNAHAVKDDAPFRSILIHGSAGEYDDIERHNPEKWGDYASCVNDPDDDRSFWIAHQLCVTPVRDGDDAHWGTWIARVDIN